MQNMAVETTTPLLASATFTGAAKVQGVINSGMPSSSPFDFFLGCIISDQTGIARIERSLDNVTWTRVTPDVKINTNDVTRVWCRQTSLTYYRVVVVNGATNQTSFLLETGFSSELVALGDSNVVTGPAAQSVLNTDLLTGVVNGWYDCGANRSIALQIVTSAGVSAGTIVFETTNDPAQTGVGVALTPANTTSAGHVTTVSPGASASQMYVGTVGRYFRARISVAFVGGTVQAIPSFSQSAASAPASGVNNIPQSNTFFNDTTTALGISATFTGTARDVGVAAAATHRYSAFNAFAFADQAGTFSIECSNDNTTWRTAATVSLVVNTPVTLSVPVMTRYHRTKLVNGAAAQGAVMVNSSYTAA